MADALTHFAVVLCELKEGATASSGPIDGLRGSSSLDSTFIRLLPGSAGT